MLITWCMFRSRKSRSRRGFRQNATTLFCIVLALPTVVRSGTTVRIVGYSAVAVERRRTLPAMSVREVFPIFLDGPDVRVVMEFSVETSRSRG